MKKGFLWFVVIVFFLLLLQNQNASQGAGEAISNSMGIFNRFLDGVGYTLFKPDPNTGKTLFGTLIFFGAIYFLFLRKKEQPKKEEKPKEEKKEEKKS